MLVTCASKLLKQPIEFDIPQSEYDEIIKLKDDQAQTKIAELAIKHIKKYGYDLGQCSERNRNINLTLYGYNNTVSDGLALGCEQGNISYVNQRYSLIDDAWASMTILNNSVPQIVPSLTIMQRNNTLIETINQTNWKLYIEQGPGGTPFGICTGQIIFGAVLA